MKDQLSRCIPFLKFSNFNTIFFLLLTLTLVMCHFIQNAFQLSCNTKKLKNS